MAIAVMRERLREPRRGRSLLPASLTVLCVLVLLEAISRVGLLPTHDFPPPSDVVMALGKESADGLFWKAVLDTLVGWFLSLAIAAALAIPVGIAIGVSGSLQNATQAILEFLRPVPSVALIPVAILVYGTGLESKVFLGVWASVWPILIQTIYGVRDVDRVGIDTAQAFQVNKLRQLWRVVLPSALPYVATGLRISSVIALTLTVTAELVIGSPGLGRLISDAQYGGAVASMYAVIFATGLLGVVLTFSLARVERQLLRWHPSHRSKAVK